MSSQCSAKYDPGSGAPNTRPESSMTCGSQAASTITVQRGPASDRVVRRSQRPHEIQVDHAVAPVAAEQLRRDQRREDEQDDRRDAVVVGVRGQVHAQR